MASKAMVVCFRSGSEHSFDLDPEVEVPSPPEGWLRVYLVGGGALSLNLAEVLWISVTVSADAAD